jgi:hypothetical protein
MKKAISVLCVVVLLATVCSAAEKIDLKLRLKAGESHEMKMTQVQDMTQTMNGSEFKMKQTQEMVMGFDCISVDANGNMDVKMSYRSMKMSMEGPMGKMEFDSAKPKSTDANTPPHEKMMGELLTAIVGCEFQMKIKPTGETSDIRGLSEMMTKIKGDSNSQPMGDIISKMFNEDQVKELTGNMMNMFPAEPVAIGDSWYDTKSMNFMMPIDIDTTYMLKGVKDGVATIDMVSKMDMGDSSKPIVIDPNNKMSMQLSGTINGTSEVDVKTGMAKKTDMTMNFSGMMKMEPNQDMPQGMTMPMTIKATATVELTK